MSIHAQEEGLFQLTFLTLAHRFPCFVASWLGTSTSRACAPNILSCVYQLKVSSPHPSLHVLFPPFFFAVVVDSPDHTVIILRDHFSSAEGSAPFRFNKDYYNLTAQVDELLWLSEMLHVLFKPLQIHDIVSGQLLRSDFWRASASSAPMVEQMISYLDLLDHIHTLLVKEGRRFARRLSAVSFVS